MLLESAGVASHQFTLEDLRFAVVRIVLLTAFCVTHSFTPKTTRASDAVDRWLGENQAPSFIIVVIGLAQSRKPLCQFENSGLSALFLALIPNQAFFSISQLFLSLFEKEF
jgi:hypothetical protein